MSNFCSIETPNIKEDRDIFIKTLEKDYIPLTSILGIAGTSYGVQLGKCENNLASVIYKGKEVIAFNRFKEITINDNINVNEITRWILQMLYIPLINPYQVIQTSRVLIKSLKRNLAKKE